MNPARSLYYWFAMLALLAALATAAGFRSAQAASPPPAKGAPAPSSPQWLAEDGRLLYNLRLENTATAVLDAWGGYLYTAGGVLPGRITRIRMSDFMPEGTLSLPDDDRAITASVIDPANDVMYVGTQASPAHIVRVRLSTFTRSGGLTLAPGEDNISAAIIDRTNGFAYFATGTTPAKIVKVQLSDLTRVAALALNPGEDVPHAAVIDVAGGYAYFGTNNIPARIIKIRLSDFTRVASVTLNSGEDSVRGAVLDAANGYLYFGTCTSPAHVIKVRMADMVRVAALTLTADGPRVSSGIQYAVNGYAYFATYYGQVVRVRLSDFTRDRALDTSAGVVFTGAAVDLLTGDAYFAGGNTQGAAVKIHLADFTYQATASLKENQTNAHNALIDPARGYFYIAINDPSVWFWYNYPYWVPESIERVRLSDFRRAGTLTLPYEPSDPGNVVTASALDPQSGDLYLGHVNFGPMLAKVSGATFGLEADIPVGSAPYSVKAMVIDSAANFGYASLSAGLTTGPGRVQRFTLSPFALSGSLPLPSGSDVPLTGAIDTAGDYAYFGTNTVPGRVARVRLSDFTYAGSLTLTSGDDNLWTSAIDPAGGYAYFGTNTVPGRVVRVRLSDFTHAGTLILPAGADQLHSAAIDPVAGYAYFGTYNSPGVVAAVRLSDFALVQTASLGAGADRLVTAALNATDGHAYFGTWTSPAMLVRVNTRAALPGPTRFLIPFFAFVQP